MQERMSDDQKTDGPTRLWAGRLLTRHSHVRMRHSFGTHTDNVRQRRKNQRHRVASRHIQLCKAPSTDKSKKNPDL